MLALDRLLAAQNDMRYLPSPRTMLESAMVHICRPEDSLSLAALEARVDRIETKLKTGVPATNPATVPAPKAPQSTPAPATPAEKEPAPKKERTPVKKTEPKPKDAEPEQAETPSAAPNPAVSPDSSAPSEPVAVPAQNPPGGAAALWRETIAAIPNMFVQAIAREGFAVRLENDTLTVGFTEAQEVKYKSISAPVNFEPVQRALQSIRPEAKLAFTLTKAAPASDQATAIAKELFGDKLSIE
jgi:hypothetical protein